MRPHDATTRSAELRGSAAPTLRALAAAVAEHPAAPCVFFQEGLDWRWLPWERLAGRVLEVADRLRGSIPLEDLEVRYRSGPTVEELVLDLALQHLGAVPCPFAEDSAEDSAEGSAAAGPIAGGAWIAEPLDPVVERASSGAARAGAGEAWRAARTVEVEAIDAACRKRPERPGRVAAWWRRPDDREVVVDVLELERPLCRAGVAWTLGRRGALVLAHERRSLEAAARWARPTRLWAETEDGRFARLCAAVVEGAARKGRLESALWSGATPPDAATRELLASRGVEVREWESRSERGSR